VYFRKRFGKKAICSIIETVNQKARATNEKANDDESDKDSDGSAVGGKNNHGKLLIDAICTPADITFQQISKWERSKNVGKKRSAKCK